MIIWHVSVEGMKHWLYEYYIIMWRVEDTTFLSEKIPWIMAFNLIFFYRDLVQSLVTPKETMVENVEVGLANEIEHENGGLYTFCLRNA